MEWLLDPAAWVGLLTLVVLEIVLGIDNLIFIAILADKLPPAQRDRARIMGLSLALIMRLGLLSVMSWLVTLTTPLFSVGPLSPSGRDLILMVGGLFLLFKGTMELHERLEGGQHAGSSGPRVYASFWVIVTQIVVLDAVFSLDSVITAVGMVDHLAIMMIAVIIAIGIMLLASKPLTRFVNAHPTVVVLCLGFLLMIGFSLLAEAFGFKVPKGYLYAAIGFSILIELCNQLARRNRARGTHALGRRQRTAQAVLRLLRAGRAGQPGHQADEVVALVDSAGDEPAFAPEESSMIERVLSVGAHDVRSIMVPRGDMTWLDVSDSPDIVVRKFATGHSRLPLCAGEASNVLGVLHFKDVMPLLQNPGPIDLVELAREPRYVMETTPVLKVLEELRASRDHMLIVVDEHGVCEGLVTPMDVLTAVAGELPEHSDDQPEALQLSDGTWLLEGRLSVGEAARLLNAPALAGDYPDATLAGCLLRAVGRIPDAGDTIQLHDWGFEVTRRDGLRVDQVHARPAGIAPDGAV